MDPAALALTPAVAPPPGQVTNFVNPPSQQATIIAVCTVTMALTLIFVSLRLYSNFRITRSPGAEDYHCVLATILSIAYIGFVVNLSYVARHMWDVPITWFTEDYWKIRFAQNMIQAFAFFTSRLPIFLLYLRLFGRNVVFRSAVYFGVVAAFAVYLSAIPLLAYFCTPQPGGSWNALAVFAKCKELVVYAVIQGSCNIALDLYIFMLPLPTIIGLHLTLKKKLGVLAIFGTGFLAVIASGIGLYYRYQLSYGPDINWNEGAYIATASVEINISIICSSMPACSSLTKEVLKGSRFFGSLWSFFDHSRFSSTRKSKPKNSKYSHDSPYPSGAKPSEHSTGSRAQIMDSGEMRLQKARSHVQVEEMNVTDDYHHIGRPGPQQHGIIRTMEVDIV